jgi:hypothetical protein
MIGRGFLGRGYLRRGQAEVRIEAQTRDLRDELAGLVIAAADFAGYRPEGGPFAISKGARFPSDATVVLKYPDRFRPLTEPEIERIVASWRRRWRDGAGL